MMRNLTTIAIGSFSLCMCAPAEQSEPHPYRADARLVSEQSVTHTVATGSSSIASSDLCSLTISNGGGAGLYRVASLDLVVEVDERAEPPLQSVVYQELELIEDWSGRAAPLAVFRAPAAANEDGTVYTDVALNVGETIVAMYWQPNPNYNAGFAALSTDGVWRQRDGQFTNQIVTLDHAVDAAAFRRILEETYAVVPREVWRRPLQCLSENPGATCPESSRIPTQVEISLRGTEPVSENCVQGQRVDPAARADAPAR